MQEGYQVLYMRLWMYNELEWPLDNLTLPGNLPLCAFLPLCFHLSATLHPNNDSQREGTGHGCHTWGIALITQHTPLASFTPFYSWKMTAQEPVQQLAHCSLEPTPPESLCREQGCSSWCCQHSLWVLLSTRATPFTHSQCSPIFPTHTTAEGKLAVLHGVFCSCWQIVRRKGTFDKDRPQRNRHHTDKPWRGSRQNLLPCGHKILPTTLYNMGLYAMPISRAEFTAVWVSFPPFPWHHSGCFFVIDLAFPFILLQAIKIILIQLTRIALENYSKVQKIFVWHSTPTLHSNSPGYSP